jgi:hypothetical protein
VNDRVLPVVMLLLGIAIVVRTLATEKAHWNSVGLLFGILLAAAGALRLWVEHRRRSL